MQSILNNKKVGLICISVMHIVIALVIAYKLLVNFNDLYNTYNRMLYIALIVDAFVILINLGASIGLLLFRPFGMILSGSYFAYKSIRSLFASVYSLKNIFEIGEFDLFTFSYTGLMKNLFITVGSIMLIISILKLYKISKNSSVIKVGSTLITVGIGINLAYIAISLIL